MGVARIQWWGCAPLQETSAQWPQNCPTANKETKIQGNKDNLGYHWDQKWRQETRGKTQPVTVLHAINHMIQGYQTIFPKIHKNPVKQGKVLHFRLRHICYSFIFKATQNFEIIFHEASCATQDHLAIQSSLIPPQKMRRQHTLKNQKISKWYQLKCFWWGNALTQFHNLLKESFSFPPALRLFHINTDSRLSFQPLTVQVHFPNRLNQVNLF